MFMPRVLKTLIEADLGLGLRWTAELPDLGHVGNPGIV